MVSKNSDDPKSHAAMFAGSLSGDAFRKYREALAPVDQFIENLQQRVAPVVEAVESFVAAHNDQIAALAGRFAELQVHTERLSRGLLTRPAEIGRLGWTVPVDLNFQMLYRLVTAPSDSDVEMLFERFYSDQENVDLLWSVVREEFALDAERHRTHVLLLEQTKTAFDAGSFELALSGLAPLCERALRLSVLTPPPVRRPGIRERVRLALEPRIEEATIESAVASSLLPVLLKFYDGFDAENGALPPDPNRHAMAHGVGFISSRRHVLQLLQALRAVMFLRASPIEAIALSLPDDPVEA